MSWGIGDLAKWLNGIRETFKGGNPNSVGNNAIQAGIVNPLKLGAEFSGVNQMYRGLEPNASVKDKSLALLTLAGLLSGQDAAMGLKTALTPEYAYGIHVSPVPGLNKIKPGSKVGVTGGGYFGDATDGQAYFWKSGDDKNLGLFQSAVNNYLERLMSGTGGGATAYSVRTPLKHLIEDGNIQNGIAMSTPKNLKVLNSARIPNPAAVVQDFMSSTAPTLSKDVEQTMETLANLIKDNPKYSSLPNSYITKDWKDILNRRLAKEVSDYEAWKARPKPKMVPAIKKPK